MRFLVLWGLALLYAIPTYGSEALTCGVANGFPPFQFSENEKPAGIDLEILNQVVNEAGMKLNVYQAKWDDVVALLRLDKIDCAAGMEINETRQKMFDFTKPIYARRNGVFVLSENTSVKLHQDLVQKRVAGDRQSFFEKLFEEKNILHKTRLIHTPTKEASMQMLKTKEVDAVIAPLEVGFYLAQQMHMKVRVIGDLDPGSPVAIAVKKGDTKLLEKLNQGLEALRKRDAFKKMLEKWQN